eukprot:2040530-Rhodomonas_salina.2
MSAAKVLDCKQVEKDRKRLELSCARLKRPRSCSAQAQADTWYASRWVKQCMLDNAEGKHSIPASLLAAYNLVQFLRAGFEEEIQTEAEQRARLQADLARCEGEARRMVEDARCVLSPRVCIARSESRDHNCVQV